MPSLRSLLPLLALCALPAWACPPLPPAQAAGLTLADLLARLPACSPEVRAALLAAGGAAADTLTAAQGPNPQLTLGAGSLSRDGIGSGPPWSKTLDHQLRIDQLVERGDKAALRRAAAQAQLQAAQADAADALRLARVNATRLYFDLAGALQRHQELGAAVELNAQSLQALQQRARAGDAAPLDAVRFQLDATRVQADLAQSVADTRALRLQLAAAIGAGDQADALTPVTDFALAPPAAGDAAAQLTQRPDLLAAQARLTAAERARDLAHAQRTRDLAVGVQFSHYPTSASNTLGTGNTLSLSVSVPLFVRHAFEGEIARAESDVATAQQARERLAQSAATEWARAQADWQAAGQRLALLVDQLLPAAERVSAGAELAYRRGASGVLDLLDARRSLRAARIERINAQTEQAKAAAQLQAALQTVDPHALP